MRESTKLVQRNPDCFPSIMEERRITVGTATAAHWLNRRPQTLRAWKNNGSGALQPLVINGRLAWPVEKIRDILGGGAV